MVHYSGVKTTLILGGDYIKLFKLAIPIPALISNVHINA